MNFMNSSQSPTFRRLVYLDWNVIILIAEGHRPAFRAALAEAKDKSDILIPFSAAHVEEADNIADQAWAPKELPEKRLQFLSKLSETCTSTTGAISTRRP